MKNKLLVEINSIRSIMGLITEEELATQASDLSKAQNLANLEGIKVNLKDLLDKTEPICIPPKTNDEKNDTIIKNFWEWSHNPQNKNKLSDIFQSIKNKLIELQKEKTEKDSIYPLNFDIFTIDSKILSEIGLILLSTIIIAKLPKKSKCEKINSLEN